MEILSPPVSGRTRAVSSCHLRSWVLSSCVSVRTGDALKEALHKSTKIPNVIVTQQLVKVKTTLIMGKMLKGASLAELDPSESNCLK